MTDSKKKKKHSEPQLLFPQNQRFLDGNDKYKYPTNLQEILNIFAKRHNLSTYHNGEMRVVLGFAGLIMGFSALSIGWVVLNNLQMPTLSIINILNLLLLLVTMLTTVALTYVCAVAINYRPNHMNELYEYWQKHGSMIKSKVISVRYGTIQYEVKLEDDSKIIGKYPTKSKKVLSSYRAGDSLYVFYADKKLHAPL